MTYVLQTVENKNEALEEQNQDIEISKPNRNDIEVAIPKDGDI